ncbi:hypothetical protein H6F93_00530 [Leptolyngbya sp. FACHB-671]|uniref:hypothetical protein n=1 Tax=Leptolyngbya sp. FACHB-671 TaxID=2692812 RepID=UPI0016820DE2|nr:hypothetical protein [Leptolyngbya sp. FACHB-671]MBD2066036.1 hypothetical protein [Leptolyngbya sp. FACHB-671]
MTVTPRQLLSPVAEYQAERHLIALGQRLEFGIEPIYLGDTWSFFGSTKLIGILIAAHQFLARYRPIADYPDAPALKALDDLLTAFFPSQTWEGYHDVDMTTDRAEVWQAAEQIYLEKTGL